MAKIIEELLVIKVSRLIKDNNNDGNSSDLLINAEFAANLEVIVQELVGENVIVEVSKE